MTEMILNRKKALLIFLNLAVLLGGVYIALPPVARSADSEPSLQEVVFDKKSHTAYAMSRARKNYDSYLKSIGINPKTNELPPAYARFVPLDKKKPDRFVALYIMGGIGSTCPALGCNVVVFDTANPKQADAVMNIYAHKFYVDATDTASDPRPVYLQSLYEGSGAESYNQAPQKWVWKNGKYHNENKLKDTQRPQ